MRYFLLTLLVTNVALAFPVPEELKDAVITVKTRDGKEYTFSANTHKVVKRTEKKPLALAPSAPVVEVVRTEVVDERPTGIISVYGVHGQRGLDYDLRGGTVDVSTNNQLGVGAMYQHRFGNAYLGAGGDSNKNVKFMFGVGL